jgi:DnaJ like chaperone protein
MSSSDISTIIFMGVVGYVIVSGFIRWREVRNIKRSTESDRQNYSDENSQEKSHTNEARAWYDVLNVSETASPETIKNAYRSLVRQYHPDKVSSLGKEFSEIAERKTKEINRAYEIAQRVKNFS